MEICILKIILSSLLQFITNKDGTESSEQDERDKDVRGGLSPEAKRSHPGFEVGVVQRKSTKPIK